MTATRYGDIQPGDGPVDGSNSAEPNDDAGSDTTQETTGTGGPSSRVLDVLRRLESKEYKEMTAEWRAR